MNREECSERIHLVDEYSRLITEFNNLLESLEGPSHERNEDIWRAVEKTRTEAQIKWDALETRIDEHKCIDVPRPSLEVYRAVGSGSVQEKAALAAIDVILVTNDERKFVEVNEAAAYAFGFPRSEIIARRIDEFFTTAGGEAIPVVWKDFIARGVQSGICKIDANGQQRKFEYHAQANFLPGLHLSVLRKVEGPDSASSSLVGALIEDLAHEVPDDPYLETVRADLLAAARSDKTGHEKNLTLRLYLAISSLLREHALLKERLRRGLEDELRL